MTENNKATVARKHHANSGNPLPPNKPQEIKPEKKDNTHRTTKNCSGTSKNKHLNVPDSINARDSKTIEN